MRYYSDVLRGRLKGSVPGNSRELWEHFTKWKARLWAEISKSERFTAYKRQSAVIKNLKEKQERVRQKVTQQFKACWAASLGPHLPISSYCA